MRARFALTSALLLVVTPALVLVPGTARPGAHPVAPTVTRLAVEGLDVSGPGADLAGSEPDAAGLRPARQGRLVPLVAPAIGTARFDLVALTWSGPATAGAGLRVRVRENGRWSPWQHLAPSGHEPDGAERATAAARAGGSQATEPLLTGGADGVQVRVDAPARGPLALAAAPAALRLVLVDGGRSAADAPGGDTAQAATRRPAIITRAQWGADESLVTGTTTIDDTVRTMFVHHTDTINSYSRAEAMAQVRSILAFHTKVRGWNDIGYNFLVDRYGRVFEGRRGSIDAPVHGAHTGGFNTEAVGVSVLGTFQTTSPTSAALGGLVDLLSWTSARYFLNPRGSAVLTSSGGASSRYAEGEQVRMRTVSGHRDAGYTDCPGDDLYPDLPWVRSAIADRLAPGLVAPQVSSTAVAWRASPAPVTVSAGVPTVHRWTLTAVALCAGRTASATLTGQTDTSISASWDLRGRDGAPVPPGLYQLALTAASPVGSVGWRTDVEVVPSPSSPPSACPVARLATGDVFTTAVTAGRVRYPDATSVVIAGTDVTEGLLAAPLAAAKQAPLLLTPAAALPERVRADVAARGVRTAYVIGNTASVGAGVVTQLRAAGVTSVVRISGRDVYSLAASIARRAGAPGRSAVVVSSASPGDLAAAAPAAAATGRPVLLVTGRRVPGATADALRALGVTRVAVVGSTVAVPQAVVDRLAAAGVTRRFRVTGPDAASTAVAVNRSFGGGSPVASGAVDPGAVLAPSGVSSWSVVAAGQARYTVFAGPGGTLPAASAAWLGARRPGSVWLAGSLGVLPSALLRQVYAAAR